MKKILSILILALLLNVIVIVLSRHDRGWACPEGGQIGIPECSFSSRIGFPLTVSSNGYSPMTSADKSKIITDLLIWTAASYLIVRFYGRKANSDRKPAR